MKVSKGEMNMLEKYFVLDKMIDKLVENGACHLDPIVRSMTRKRNKLYAALSNEERGLILVVENESPEPLM